MPHEKSWKYAWEPRNDDWFCPTPSVVLKILDHWGDVLICLLINTSAPSHWLKSVVWPVGPVLKFRILMVFTVTSSDCKVKKARFYEFLFKLGWRLIGNTSLYKFSAPKHVSFRKYSSLNFRVFTVRDTKIGSYLLEKKSLRLIFSSLTISSIRRYVYAQVC